jgi:hypothetical protein
MDEYAAVNILDGSRAGSAPAAGLSTADRGEATRSALSERTRANLALLYGGCPRGRLCQG